MHLRWQYYQPETWLKRCLSIASRVGIRLPFASVGMLGFINWESTLIKYQPAKQSIFASTTYSNTRRRLAYGPTIVGNIPGTGIRLAAEYIMNVNPFADDDYLKEKGWVFPILLCSFLVLN